MKKPDNTPENKKACLCPTCPLFSPCNKEKGEKFFCGTEKSGCFMDSKKMCICGGCTVFNKYDLSGGYFCIDEIR